MGDDFILTSMLQCPAGSEDTARQTINRGTYMADPTGSKFKIVEVHFPARTEYLVDDIRFSDKKMAQAHLRKIRAEVKKKTAEET